MADAEFLKGWHDVDDWVRRDREAEVPKGHGLTASWAISFVGDRPDIIVETPPPVIEDVDDIVTGLIEFFGALRPERLAIIWPNVFELDSGEQILAVRLNLAEPDGTGRWRWTTRVHPYMLDTNDRRKIAEWGDPFEIARPPDPGSQRLRKIYGAATHRRLVRRGRLKIPPRGDWDVACHPDSTTMDRFAPIQGPPVRAGRSARPTP